MWFQLKRVAFDVALFLIVLALLFAAPITMAGWQLILFKALLVSGGFLHAHVTRKLAFPYIDFNKTCDPMNKALVIALYVIFIFAWSRGG